MSFYDRHRIKIAVLLVVIFMYSALYHPDYEEVWSQALDIVGLFNWSFLLGLYLGEKYAE